MTENEIVQKAIAAGSKESEPDLFALVGVALSRVVERQIQSGELFKKNRFLVSTTSLTIGAGNVVEIGAACNVKRIRLDLVPRSEIIFNPLSEDTMRVSGASDPTANGDYTKRGIYQAKSVFTLIGKPDPNIPLLDFPNSIFWDTSYWIMQGDTALYLGNTNTVSPADALWNAGTEEPYPTVKRAPYATNELKTVRFVKSRDRLTLTGKQDQFFTLAFLEGGQLSFVTAGDPNIDLAGRTFTIKSVGVPMSIADLPDDSLTNDIVEELVAIAPQRSSARERGLATGQQRV